jgi:hypothetical protein
VTVLALDEVADFERIGDLMTNAPRVVAEAIAA